MGKGAKVLLGLGTAWPLLWMFIFMGAIFYQVFSGAFAGRPSGPHAGPPPLFMLLFAGHFLTILLTFGLLVIYMIHLFRSDRVAQDKKALWAVVLFMGNMVAMPVYFYFYVWKDPPPPAPDGPKS